MHLGLLHTPAASQLTCSFSPRLSTWESSTSRRVCNFTQYSSRPCLQMANRFSVTAFNREDKRPSRILAESFPWSDDRGCMIRPPLGEVHIRLLGIDRQWKRKFLCSGYPPDLVHNEGVTRLRHKFDLGFAAERNGDWETAASAYAACYTTLLPFVTARTSWSSAVFWDSVWLLLWAAIGFLPWRQLSNPSIASLEHCLAVLCTLATQVLLKAGQITVRLRAMLALVAFDLGYATSREEHVCDAMDMLPLAMALDQYLNHYRTPRVVLCLWLRNQHSFLGNYAQVMFWEQERSKWADDASGAVVPPFGPRPNESLEAANFGSRAKQFHEEELMVAMGKPGRTWVPDPDAWVPDLETAQRMLPELMLEGAGGQASLGDTALRGEGALAADWFLLDDDKVLERHRDLHTILAETASLNCLPELYERIAMRVCWDGNSQLEGKLRAALADWSCRVQRLREGQAFYRGYFLYCEILLDLKNVHGGPHLDAGDLDAVIGKLQAAVAAFTEHVDQLKTRGDAGNQSFRRTCSMLSDCYWRLCTCWRNRHPRESLTDVRYLTRFMEWQNMSLDYMVAAPAAFDIHSDHYHLALAHCALAILTYTSRYRVEAAANRQRNRSAYLSPQNSHFLSHFLPATPDEIEGMKKAIHHHGVCTQILCSVLAASRQLGEGMLGWSPSVSYQAMHDIHLWLQLVDPPSACTHLEHLMDLLLWSERTRVRTLVLQLEALLPPEVPRCLCSAHHPNIKLHKQRVGIYSNDECGRNFVEQSRLACGSGTVFLEYNITGDTMSRFLEAEQLTIHVVFPHQRHRVLSPGPLRWLSFQNKGMEDFHNAMSSVRSYEEMGGTHGVLRYLEHLHRLLIDPVAHALSRMAVTDKLVISPCGDLNRIPFALLRRPEDGKYLFERHTVCVVPSFLALGLSLQLQRHQVQQACAAGAAEDSVFGGVVANPFYFDPRQRLSHSVREMDMIRDLFHTAAGDRHVVCLQDEDASPENLLSLAARCTAFLHVAAHAQAETGGLAIGAHVSTQEGEHPSRGALLLAESDTDTGVLRAEDIMLNTTTTGATTTTSASADATSTSTASASAAPPHAKCTWLPQLVVLSACDSGNGQIRDDGLVNLPRAIMGAGVPTVVASLWKVEDCACLDVMTLFYQALQRGDDVTTALRTTMMHFKDDSNIYRWGAFQAWGVPTTHLPSS